MAIRLLCHSTPPPPPNFFLRDTINKMMGDEHLGRFLAEKTLR